MRADGQRDTIWLARMIDHPVVLFVEAVVLLDIASAHPTVDSDLFLAPRLRKLRLLLSELYWRICREAREASFNVDADNGGKFTLPPSW